MLGFAAIWTKLTMNGLHLIVDLYRCHCTPELLRDRDVLETLCVEECSRVGLTPLGAHFFQFLNDDGTKAGVTGTVVLAESHLAIHTWPESASVTLDVYVCNFSRDNSERAHGLFERLLMLLKPGEAMRHEVVRGQLPAEV